MILDIYPKQALTKPGTTVTICIKVSSSEATDASLSVTLLERTTQEGRIQQHLPLSAGVSVHEVELEVPSTDARGYRIKAELSMGGKTTTAWTAVLVASHWRLVPRYGFLSEFAPGDHSNDRVQELAKYHLTIVQYYDWMYRHYRFLSPDEPFEDALGRELSRSVIESRIAACQKHNMAAIAYGAVYGAETEFIQDKPEMVLYDSAGEPIRLIDLFHINDIRKGSAWREHILQEFEVAVEELGFDGVHMDQYGFPKLSYDHEGDLVDIAKDFPSIIDEAAERLAAIRPEVAVIFNAVNDWPIHTVAKSNQAAVYIEVWPPHDRYQDLVSLIQRARDLSGKQVILSAYLKPFVEGGETAEWAARYITAIIASAGGHHLVLGEGDKVLRDAYYPNHGQLSEVGAAQMRCYYDHTAAYTHYLHAPDLATVERHFTDGINGTFTLKGAVGSAIPQVSKVWLSVKQRDGQFIINLVNLTGLTEDAWDVHQVAAPWLEGVRLECEPFIRIQSATWETPDDTSGTTDLNWQTDNEGKVVFKLPALQVWGTLVLDFA